MFQWKDGPTASAGVSDLDARWKDLRAQYPIPIEQYADVGAKFLLTRQHEKAIDVYREILKDDPSHAAAKKGFGTALLRSENYKDAQTVLLDASLSCPDDYDLKLKLAAAHKELGQLQQAIDVLNDVRRECPKEMAAYVLLAQVELMREHFDGAMRAYVEGMACPGNKTVLRALYWTILAAQGRIDDLEEWADPKKLVRIVRVDDAVAHALNQDLKRQILESPGTRPLGPQRTLNLTDMVAPDRHGQPLEAFQRVTRSEIEKYMEQPHVSDVIPELEDLETAWLSLWALIFQEKGNLDGHYHQAALISGAYYVQCGALGGEEGREGWIEFGTLPKEIERGMPSTQLKETCNRMAWSIRPEEGMMLLFPSFLFHGTIPTQAGHNRICIGFDLRPGEFKR